MPPKAKPMSRATTRPGQLRAIYNGIQIHPSVKKVTGLTKRELMKNKNGKIVSKKQHAQGNNLHAKMENEGKLASPFKKKRTSKSKRRTSKPKRRTSKPKRRTSKSKRTSKPKRRTSKPKRRTSKPKRRTSKSKRTSKPKRK
jgi:hypothetical protein